MSFTSPQTYIHLLIAMLMLALPGVALVMALRRWVDKRPTNIVSALLPGFGLSIAFWPLMLLYVSLVELRVTPWLLWLLLVLSAGYVLFELWTQKAEGRGQRAEGRGQKATLTPSPKALAFNYSKLISRLALLAITLLYLIFRLGDIAGLNVPLFGDSMHHSMITSLIMDSSRVPANYLPYVPVETFTYHFGFHTLAAFFAMMIGSTPQYAVLLLGQILNSLSIPLAYMLNRTLFGSRLAGLGAALITAAISLMPAFYVNWGRYTQLSGHLLLMLALVSLVRTMRPNPKRGDFVMLTLSVAGLVVVHYRILIFFGLFAVGLGAWQLIAQWGKWRSLLLIWGRSVAAMGVGLLVALPWIINLVSNYIEGLIRRLGTVTADYLALYNNPNTLLFYAGRLLPLIAGLGIVAGVVSLWQSQRKAASQMGLEDSERKVDSALPPYAACFILAIWVALLVTSLWIVPGAIGSYTVAITLYIPLSALGGYGISALCGWVQRPLRLPRWVFAPLMVIAAPALAMMSGTVHVADLAAYNYLQAADEQAFSWIKVNVGSSAKFLISSEFSYTGRAVTASDAGMWLPLLTGRNVSVPALNSWMERPIETDFFTRTKWLAGYTQPMTQTLTVAGIATLDDLVKRDIIPADRSLNDPRTLDLMRQLGITHVYVGALGGASKPRLDVVEMRKETQHYTLVYFKDGVYVFEVAY